MAPLMAQWLVSWTTAGGTNNIAWYFIALIVIGAVCVFLSKETLQAQVVHHPRHPALAVVLPDGTRFPPPGAIDG